MGLDVWSIAEGQRVMKENVKEKVSEMCSACTFDRDEYTMKRSE